MTRATPLNKPTCQKLKFVSKLRSCSNQIQLNACQSSKGSPSDRIRFTDLVTITTSSFDNWKIVTISVSRGNNKKIETNIFISLHWTAPVLLVAKVLSSFPTGRLINLYFWKRNLYLSHHPHFIFVVTGHSITALGVSYTIHWGISIVFFKFQFIICAVIL